MKWFRWRRKNWVTGATFTFDVPKGKWHVEKKSQFKDGNTHSLIILRPTPPAKGEKENYQ